MNNSLFELQQWYKMHCDGDWEHLFGISIDTLDNPGWILKIDLTDTLLEDVDFQAVEQGDSESSNMSWLKCYKEESRFIGMGGVNDLEKIINIFIDWSSCSIDTAPWDDEIEKLIDICNKSDDTEILRLVYQKFDDIPNEHERKRELILVFNKKWAELINQQEDRGLLRENPELT